MARRVDDPHTAADLTAEVFLAAIASAPGYRPAAAGEAGRSQLRQGADGSVSFTIDRGMVAPGATLVIESSGGDGGPTTMSIAVADGDVGPCRS